MSPRMGRSALFPQRQRHTPMRHFIPPMFTCDLEFVRNLPEVLRLRDLGQIIPRLGNSSSWIPASLDICLFGGQLDNIYWCAPQSWGRDSGDESRLRHCRAVSRTMHGYHNGEFFSQTDQVRKTHSIQQPTWWARIVVPQLLWVPTSSVLPYFGFFAMDNSPACCTIWSAALTEWHVFVAMLTVHSAIYSLDLGPGCPDTDIYASSLAPVAPIFRVQNRAAPRTRTGTVGEVMAGCRHPPVVLLKSLEVSKD